MVSGHSPMFSHVLLGSNDLAKAQEFYDPILTALGWVLRYSNHDVGKVLWQPAAGGRPFFGVGRPLDGGEATFSNGATTALLAPDRAIVRLVYDKALALGAKDEGAPGLRPHYHPDYYGAYFRDLDGNKLCICCHFPEEQAGR